MTRPIGDREGHHERASVVTALLVAFLAVACGTDRQAAVPAAPVSVPSPPVPVPSPAPSYEAPEAEPETLVVPEGDPVRVEIPAIDVDAGLVEVGLRDDAHMEVPEFGLAGWYTEGPRPGPPGPAVIVGHVDSKAGPDVFYRLKDLTPGEDVHVHYDSGDVARFVVRDDPVQTDKDELPVGEIWPVTSERRLALITCGGIFDRSIGHYEDNIIVYADPAEDGHSKASTRSS